MALNSAPGFSHRPYQTTAMQLQNLHRVVAFFWARRCRKSTTAGDIYFQDLSLAPGRTVIHCSASLLLGRESIGLTLSSLERASILAQEAGVIRGRFEANAALKGLHTRVANNVTGREYTSRLSSRHFLDLYQARAMELRLYFNSTQYSRELILAPSVQTFRSYRALVGLDEFGYLPPELARELVNSADAMMRDTPDRRLLFFSNLCLADHHPWYEMTLPQCQDGLAMDGPLLEEDVFPASETGHLYTGRTGRVVHRVALRDAYLSGHFLYDDLGHPLSYEGCRHYPALRAGWDVSYGLNHQPGGIGVVDAAALALAQQRGLGRCHFADIRSEHAFGEALRLLQTSLGDGPVGLGFDVATTSGDISNPSSVTVRELNGSLRWDRLKLIWKERQPQLVRLRLRQILETIRNRCQGGPARRLCVDATNERYFAADLAANLAPIVLVQCVVASQSVLPPPQGASPVASPINYKTWLGDLESALVNEGRLALPPDDYIRQDYRRMIKKEGRYFCLPDPLSGAHADTFDSGKLAELALIAGHTGSPATTRPTRSTAARDRRNRALY